jgi:hypothetical protein
VARERTRLEVDRREDEESGHVAVAPARRLRHAS